MHILNLWQINKIMNLSCNQGLIIQPLSTPISNDQKAKGPIKYWSMVEPLKFCKNGQHEIYT